MKKLLYSVVVALLLAACASDNVEPPAPLKGIAKPQYRIDEMWSRWIDASEATLRVNLRIAHDDRDLYIATNSGMVYAFELKSGATDWKAKTKLTLDAGPGLGNGMLVVASSGGTVVAFDSKTGKTLWKTDVKGEVLATPAIGPGSVVIRTTDGRILALSNDSGRQLWKTSYDVPRLSLRGAGDPVIQDRMLLAGLDNGKLVALNLDDGTQMWQATVTNATGADELARVTDVDGDLAVSDDRVYAAGYHGQTVSVSRANGQVEWARDLTSYTGVTLDGDYLYITDLHSAVWCLDRRTGVPVWTQPEMRAHNLTLPVPYDANSLVLGGIDGHIHFISKKDGSVMARTSLGSAPILAPPVVVGDEVLVLTTGGTVGAFRVTPRGG